MYMYMYTYVYILSIFMVITMSSRVLNTHTSGAYYNNNNNDVKDGDLFCYSEWRLVYKRSSNHHIALYLSDDRVKAWNSE